MSQLSNGAAMCDLVISSRLLEQIHAMVLQHEDYIPDADGVDSSVHLVVNDFNHGVWLCEHHGECDMGKFTRIKMLMA
jgi:hypothetical protein